MMPRVITEALPQRKLGQVALDNNILSKKNVLKATRRAVYGGVKRALDWFSR